MHEPAIGYLLSASEKILHEISGQFYKMKAGEPLWNR